MSNCMGLSASCARLFLRTVFSEKSSDSLHKIGKTNKCLYVQGADQEVIRLEQYHATLISCGCVAHMVLAVRMIFATINQK